MQEHDFHIPKRIISLDEKGVWPSSRSSIFEQDKSPLTKEYLVKKIAPEEKYICFSPIDSFYLLSSEFENNDVMMELGAIDQIDPNLCLIIGDFGIGSDSYIVLDYSEKKLNPCVKRLVWKDGGNYWEKISNSVDEFLDVLKL